jgi:hypothetical protein
MSDEFAIYTFAFLTEFERHIPDIDLKTALYLVEVGFSETDGDAVEDARAEAEEWKFAA